MSGSYSGVDTFHTSMTTIENGDAAIGSTFNTPDKQVYDNTLHLKNRADAVDDVLDDHADLLDDLGDESVALDARLDIVEPALTTAQSNISALQTDVAKRDLPGQFYGGFSDSFTIGAATMVSLVSTGAVGEAARRASVVAFDASGTPQADKCLLLPSGGVYLVMWQINGDIGSTSAAVSRLRVQESANDAFSAPITIADISAPIADSALLVNWGRTLMVRCAFGAKYLRFLLTTPASDSIAITGTCDVLCVGETA